MGRGKGGGGPRRPVKGFRPGKEPPQLKKRLAKDRYGEVNWAQERMIELFAERTPEESAALMRRWRMGLLGAAAAMTVLAGLLFLWATVAGTVALVIGAVLLFLWWRLRRQREALEAMAETVSGGGRGRRHG